MGRAIRMVPKDWKHPMREDGQYIPLLDYSFATDDKEWDEGYAKWQQGFQRDFRDSEKWLPIDEEDKNLRYSDAESPRPNPDDYMPYWMDGEKTHMQMYETVSEGTPISPVMETPEELAHWLAESGASAGGYMTATYEQWLRVCKGGYAPSLVITDGQMTSGVAGIGV